MRRAIMISPGHIKFKEAEKPLPGKEEVLLRIKKIGICGSDVHVWHGKHPYTSYPVIQGHEFSATVEEVGKAVKNINIGAKVTATPQIVCGECGPCKRGDYNICNELKVEGFQAPGVAQDFFVTDSKKVVVLPEAFSFEQGAMVEPASVAVHAVDKAGDVKNKNIIVFGAGTIGNLVGQVLKAKGAKVLITDLSDYRLDIANKCGLKNTSNAKKEKFIDAIKRIFGEEEFSIAFECVGVEQTISNAIENIQKGGKIVVVGVFSEDPRVNLGFVQDRELKLFGTLMYKYEDYEKSVSLIENGLININPLITEHFKFEDYEKAYHYIDKQGHKVMKVIIDL